MTLVASNARVGITGAIRRAPIGTTAPTDAVSPLDAAFGDLGYISDEGVNLSFEDSVENKFAWQSATLIRSITSESVTALNFSMLEWKGNNLEYFFRGSTMVEVAADNFRLDGGPITADPHMLVADIVDGTRAIRWLFGNAEVVARGEISITNSDLMMLPVTLNFYPDANGRPFQVWSNDPAWATS